MYFPEESDLIQSFILKDNLPVLFITRDNDWLERDCPLIKMGLACEIHYEKQFGFYININSNKITSQFSKSFSF